MNGLDYQQWMRRAFLNVEAVLATELCAQTSYLNEEYLRTALVKGLVMSEPSHAGRVTTEEDAVWSSNPCVNAATCSEMAGGRPIQHDVSIAKEATDPNDKGLRCEVKWLKSAKAIDVAMDLWKLALSRGSAPENSSLRTYLLIGGVPDAFGDTLATLEGSSFPLRRQQYGQRAPAPTLIDFAAAVAGGASTTGHRALQALLSWGSKPKHCRTPPTCRVALRAFVRAWWRAQTPAVPHWRVVLWELHAHGLPNDQRGTLAWPALPSTCP